MSRLAIGQAVAVMLLVALTLAIRSRFAGPPAPQSTGVLSPEQLQELLPYRNLFGPASRSEFNQVVLRPFGVEKFAFQILLPKSWQSHVSDATPAQRSGDDTTPMAMAEMAPRGRDDVVIEVRYVRVPDRVTLERFVNLYAEKAGFEIVARQHGDFNKRHVEDALLRKSSPELGGYLTRLTVSRRGEVIYLVAGSAVEAQYGSWKRAFAVAAVSFEPLQK